MTMNHVTRGTALFGAGALAGATLAGGIAYAAIPASNTGNITACVLRTTGATRIIDYQAGRRCHATERTVTWNSGSRDVSRLTTVAVHTTVANADTYARLHAACPTGTVVLSALGFWKYSVNDVGTALYTGVAEDPTLASNVPGQPFKSASAFSLGSSQPNDTMYLQVVCAVAH